MKNNEQAPQINAEDERNRAEQRKQKEWGEKIAQKFGIDFAGEHFKIHHHDSTGKEVRCTHLLARKIVEGAKVEYVIEAILKYPNMELDAAIKQIEKENQLKEKSNTEKNA